jgi:methionine aminopeptidase
MMREAGRIVAEVLEAMRALVQPGVTTAELDRWAEDYIRRRGGIPAFKGYPSMKDEGGPPYPATLCTSVNHVLVHGIPGPYRLREGDIISIDVGVNFRGYFADGAITLPVGEISPEARRLIEVTQAALWAAIAQARAGRRLGDIQWAIQHTVESQWFPGGSGVRQPRGRAGPSRGALFRKPGTPRTGPSPAARDDHGHRADGDHGRLADPHPGGRMDCGHPGRKPDGSLSSTRWRSQRGIPSSSPPWRMTRGSPPEVGSAAVGIRGRVPILSGLAAL